MSTFFKLNSRKKPNSLKISNPILFDEVKTPDNVEAIPIDQAKIVLKNNSSQRSSILTPSPVESFKKKYGSNSSSQLQPVILISKYKFQAYNSRELTIDANEPLKLISRQGDGWLLVTPIGRLGVPGLVPASYCKAVNFENNSILDDDWLIKNQYSSSINNQENNQIQENTPTSQMSQYNYNYNKSESNTSANSDRDTLLPNPLPSSPISSIKSSSPSISIQKDMIDNLNLISSISINSFSSHNDRYWYKIDFKLKNGKMNFLCRYYQDFYNLHLSLFDHFSSMNNFFFLQKLPSLPEPIQRPNSSRLLKRCSDLNDYIQNLIEIFKTHEIGDHADEAANDILLVWLLPKKDDLELSTLEYSSFLSKEMVTKPEEYFSGEFTKPRSLEVVNIKLLSPANSAQSSPIDSPKLSLPKVVDSWSSKEEDQHQVKHQVEEEEQEEEEEEKTIVETEKKEITKQQNEDDISPESFSPTPPLFHNNAAKLNIITERRNHHSHQNSKSNENYLSINNPEKPSPTINSYIKVKVISNNGKDILAMRMFKDSSMTVLKLSISSRLHIYDYLLSYKDFKDGFFKPLRTNKDLQEAIYRNKIVIKVDELET
ncbi:hypothetical protein PACTADRAFT_2466 [Pachysolen tannophilus NRRL Y-2460]|uniref:SH3 domain-containing protein n=1 Tax=Pachysolen tannophilus NRRL Y-2460 TaxID=669874 RepID=A0A1E4TWR4_PACTA|nr:hypothetical protein PACTADRAFT_2466 [Pachysolen tannophilus NRRL Y-2460]